MGPVARTQRIETIDILRGFAVFGIILADVNVTFGLQTPADHYLAQLHRLLVVNKFWPLFSFLFGLGFALQIARAKARGASFLPLYVRRLCILFLFGVANKLVLLQVWRGDILHAYAILGFALLLFDGRSLRTILAVSAMLLLTTALVKSALTPNLDLAAANAANSTEARDVNQRRAEDQAWREREARIRGEGDYWQLTVYTIQRELRPGLRQDRYFWWAGGIFPMFLLGLYAGRRRLFEDLAAHIPLFRRVQWWGLGLGILGFLAGAFFPSTPDSALPSGTRMLLGLLTAVGNPALSLFYGSCVVLLAQTTLWQEKLAPLAAAGRMTLTNYLLQSVAFAVICPTYGLGLSGKLSPIWSISLAILIFHVQVILSLWWMKRFRFGAAEWLWRSLTYKKLQPVRV